MIFALEQPPGTFSEIASDVVVGGTRIPFANLPLMSESERNAVGIHGLTVPRAPDGMVLASYSIERLGGVVQVVPAYAPAPPAHVNFLSFMGLLTNAEQVAIVGSSDPQVRLFLAEAEGAEFIDLGDPRISSALSYLVSVGILASSRPAQILANTSPA